MEFKKFTLKTHTDARHSLVPLELKDYIDFEVKRVYYFYDMRQPTSAHCHKIEQEFFVCLTGSLIAIIDRGAGKEELPLKQNEAIYVSAYVWHGFKEAAPGTIILALSSTNYDASREDYIDNYEEYLNLRRQRGIGPAVS